MESLTKDILKYLNNEHTKVETKEDFKGNYYSYLIDTIYVARSFEQQKVPDAAKNINKEAAKLIVVCHECIHSMQSKIAHILNAVFSNLSIILSIVCIILGLFWTNPLCLKIAIGAILITSVIVRLILEDDAINGSIKLASDVVSKDIVEEITQGDIQQGAEYILKYKCLALLRMIVDKIIFLILVLVI